MKPHCASIRSVGADADPLPGRDNRPIIADRHSPNRSPPEFPKAISLLASDAWRTHFDNTRVCHAGAVQHDWRLSGKLP